MADRDSPATKGDLEDLEARLHTDMGDLEARLRTDIKGVEDRLTEAFRDSETKLLKAFYTFAESNQARLTAEEREATVKRLNIPPAA